MITTSAFFSGLILGASLAWFSWRRNVQGMRDVLHEYQTEACERVGLPPPARGFDSLRMHPKSDEAWKRKRNNS